MKPFLSVRARLFVFCLGLLLVLGGANLLLGYLLRRGEADQFAQQQQYRRFETIFGAQQAMVHYRHTRSQLNSALLLKDRDLKVQAEQAWKEARQNLDEKLLKLESFDPVSARIIQDALSELPFHTQRIMQAIISGKQVQAEQSWAEFQRRIDLIENTLNSAIQRENAQSDEIQRLAKERVSAAISLAGLIIVTTGVVGVLLTLLVVRSIIQPLQTTATAIRQVNAGETEIDLPPVSRDEFGDIAVALRQFRDQAERLRRLAYQDPLTGLSNRARLEEALHQAVESCRQTGAQLALFYLDLDNFRSVNDSLGHKTGDRYLCEAASRLHRFIPADALLCRYSGDKFAVLLEGLRSQQTLQLQLSNVADCILRGMAEPYLLGDHLLHMSVSIGIAVFPGDGKTGEQIVSSADAAMYVAKKNGRNNARFASAQLTADMRKELAVADDIRRGLEKGEFEPFYQPVVDVEQARVVGAEALLRWHHPQRGIVLPGEFIRTAEETGLINALGEHCLIKADEQAARWWGSDRQIRVSVNLSARQVQDGRILPILRNLRAPSVAAEGHIEFELTESVLLDPTERSQQTLNEIKKLGHRLGLDDFGTGYSSFSYLQRLPIDKIKIDRMFVAKMSSSRQALAIISATLALARSLDLEVVAEGVETDVQMRQLRDLGCKLQQGFYFTPALPAGEFETWAAAHEQSARQEL